MHGDGMLVVSDAREARGRSLPASLLGAPVVVQRAYIVAELLTQRGPMTRDEIRAALEYSDAALDDALKVARSAALVWFDDSTRPRTWKHSASLTLALFEQGKYGSKN